MRVVHAVALLVGSALLTGSTLTFYENTQHQSLHPLYARNMVDQRSQELGFDRLVSRSAIDWSSQSPLVDLSAVEVSGDKKSIRLPVKKGIKWHDGKDFTADDICFTVDAMIDPGTPSPVAQIHREDLSGCIVDKRAGTATVHFTRPFYNPLDHLGFRVLPKHHFSSTAIMPDSDFAAMPVGTGPMKVRRTPQGLRYTAVANAHHNPKIQVMQQLEGGDPTVAVQTLKLGSAQGMISVPPSRRAEISAADDMALVRYDLRSWWFVALNTNKGALQDPRVREALDNSLDRRELVQLSVGAIEGEPTPPAKLISGPFVGSSPYYNRNVKPLERSNLAKTKELMQAAGARDVYGRWVMDEQAVSLRIGIQAGLDGEAQDILEQVGNQLAAAGFERSVHRISADDWNRRAVTGQLDDFDLLIGKWSFGTVEDVSPLFHTRRDGKGYLNIFNYSDPEVDALLSKFEGASTDTGAQDAFHELHRTVAEQRPYLFLWTLDTRSAWRNEMHSVTITPYHYFTAFDRWSFDG